VVFIAWFWLRYRYELGAADLGNQQPHPVSGAQKRGDANKVRMV
jgi:hypothetical protein